MLTKSDTGRKSVKITLFSELRVVVFNNFSNFKIYPVVIKITIGRIAFMAKIKSDIAYFAKRQLFNKKSFIIPLVNI
jgi:hypothetical protein